MIRIDKLNGIMAEKGVSGRELAKVIGVHEQTFYLKMKRGVFGSDEIEKIIDRLDIKEPMEIFFAKEVT